MPVDDIPEDLRPAALIEKLELTSRAKAERSLLMGINDIIEMSSRWSPDAVAQLDEEMMSIGLPALSSLRKTYSKKYERALARGCITTEVEYYFLKGIADSILAAGTDEKAQVDLLLNEYLQRKRPGKRPKA